MFVEDWKISFSVSHSRSVAIEMSVRTGFDLVRRSQHHKKSST